MSQAITELVTIDGYYAVRRTRQRFGMFTEVRFLNLRSSVPDWCKREYNAFERCITNEIEDAKRQMAKYGTNIGDPVATGIIPLPEFMAMLKLAETDEGMADLLSKAKEFYYLKRA